jgi:hypothetical protein
MSSERRHGNVVGCFSAVYWLGPAFDGASKQKFHKAFIWPARFALEQVFAAVDPLNLELLPCLNAVLLPDLRGENDLPFAGDCRRHTS